MADKPPRPDAPPASPKTPSSSKDAKADEADPPPVAESVADPPADCEIIDMTIFEQILELDEDGTHEFSKEMVTAYFEQASSTFENMDSALAEENLPELSSLGHFLKGSSAALGIHKVQATCEKMQHYGVLRDEEAGKDLKPAEALDKIKILLAEVKAEYAGAEKWLKKWYKDELKDPFDEQSKAS